MPDAVKTDSVAKYVYLLYNAKQGVLDSVKIFLNEYTYMIYDITHRNEVVAP